MVGVLSNKIQENELKLGDHIYSWRHSYIYAHHGIYVGNGTVIHFTRGPGQEIGTGTVLDRFIFSSSPSNPSKPPCPICGDQSKSDGVISSCLECFLYGGELYLFQYGVSLAMFLAKARGGTCTLAPSDPPGAVLHRAEYLLQNGFGAYNIFKNNCEDFAIYCKTGLIGYTNVSVGRSGQAASYLAAVKAIASSPPSYLAAVKAIASSPPSYLAAVKAIASSPLRFYTVFSGSMVWGCGIYCISRIVSDIGVQGDMRIPVESLVTCSRSDTSEASTETPKED